MKYDHASIEKKWQKKWEEEGVYRTPDTLSNDKKAYILDMFPYPSGQGLHVGHPKGYIATDVIARKKMMEGYDVLHPMGWDAFGLPAENYALKTKTHPKESTDANVARYKEQLSIIGLSYDWDREINTTDSAYYKWTQWVFVKMFEKGLAYESHEPINWCPSCKTGLANEDLDGGVCERCGSEIEKKPLRQWVLRITDYADRLLEDLEGLDWPEQIKESQRNWIGKSVGTEIQFQITSSKSQIANNTEHLKSNISNEDAYLTVFTTRADTLFGCTYVVVAPEHALIKNNESRITNYDEVRGYVATAGKKTEIERTAEGKEKTGVKIEGIEAINPANGEHIPVFVADYVLADYGTGAVMAVPAHDERDFAFATKYNLPINDVVIPDLVDPKNPPREGKDTVARTIVHGIVHDPNTDTYLCLEWPGTHWTTLITGGADEGEDLVEATKREIAEETGYTDIAFVRSLGSAVRNQYFATHKDENRLAFAHAMLFELKSNTQEEVAPDEKERHTPVWLTWEEFEARENKACTECDIWRERLHGRVPFTKDGWVVDAGEFSHTTSAEARIAITKWLKERGVGRTKTTYKLRDWVFSRQRYWGEPIPVVHCKTCGVVAVPEQELPVTLPDVKSYEPTGTGESPLAGISEWVHTTCPTCGGEAKRETNTMPQWAGSSWYYLRYIDPRNDTALVDPKKEKYWMPVDTYVGGAEHATRHLIYARFWHKFLYDIGIVSGSEPFMKLQHVGLIGGEDGRKMSKRFGNVVNPDDVVHTYGADTLRIYEMFMGPFDQNTGWSTENIMGARRFIERIWKLAEKVSDAAPPLPQKTETLLHKTIKKVGDDIDTFGFNTAIAALMILLNALEKEPALSKETYLTFLSLVAPFAPHIAEELGKSLGEEGSIVHRAWPIYDESKLTDDTITIAVQVNGKVRGTFETSVDASQEELENEAQTLSGVQKHIEDKEIVKIVTVPGKLVNIVIAP